MARIDVKSSCMVTMANIYQTPMTRIELTPWDLPLLSLDPIQKGILFHKPESQEINTNLINHLKNSLSRALDFFPPLAGRLSTTENDDKTSLSCYFVDCNNAGVEFTHAVAGAVSISDILEPIYIPEIVSSLFPLNGVPNCEGFSKPLLGIQITELVDGLFIGCTANHVVTDGTSFWHFFNSWSEISRGLDTISKTPVFSRWFPSNVSQNRAISIPPFERKNSVQPPLLERVFHFSKENVAKLKAKANSEAGTDKISSLQALSAHLWRSCTRSQHSETSQKEARLIILIGGRARIPLPDGYFGNAVHLAVLTEISEAELLENGLGHAALKINEFVAQQSSEAVIKHVEDWVKEPALYQRGSFSFAITSSPRHNVYGNDFGWGKPIAVRSGKGQKFDGKITTFPAAEHGGIDVEVCLAPAKLKAMEKDAEFLEAFSV